MATLSCPAPAEIKPLLGSGNYIFNLVKFPEISFFIQDVNLPDLNLDSTAMATSVHTFPIPGNDLTFSPLTCTFVVDEKMSNYLAIYQWLLGMGYPESHEMYRALMSNSKNQTADRELAKGYTDGTLSILGNNEQPIMQAQLIDCFPISLSGLQFTTKDPDARPVTATVTFLYSYYLLKVAT
jgi:hypothetical protein